MLPEVLTLLAPRCNANIPRVSLPPHPSHSSLTKSGLQEQACVVLPLGEPLPLLHPVPRAPFPPALLNRSTALHLFLLSPRSLLPAVLGTERVLRRAVTRTSKSTANPEIRMFDQTKAPPLHS